MVLIKLLKPLTISITKVGKEPAHIHGLWEEANSANQEWGVS